MGLDESFCRMKMILFPQFQIEGVEKFFFIKLNSSIGYSLRVVSPGDDMSLVHDIWWHVPPTVFKVRKGKGLVGVGMTETAFVTDPSVTPCISDTKAYHLKIRGELLRHL